MPRHHPIPSSRDDDYLARCRFDSFEEAALIADKVVEAEERRRVEQFGEAAR